MRNASARAVGVSNFNSNGTKINLTLQRQFFLFKSCLNSLYRHYKIGPSTDHRA